MINFLLAFGIFLSLCILFFVSVLLGYRFGIYRKTRSERHSLGLVRVAEGTVFALFGLLVAFSFSGAYTRFEERKIKIISEVNAIEEAYLYTGLLEPVSRENMQALIKEYVDSRIATYQRLSEFSGFWDELGRYRVLARQVGQATLEAVHKTNNIAATQLFLPAINNMLEIANERIMLTQIHPAGQIFFLLIGLGALSAFLTGFRMSARQKFNLVHILCFVIITAYTLYVIIDMEFPRIGMIQVKAFDHFMVEIRDRMN